MLLPLAEFAYKNSVHSSIAMALFKVCMGDIQELYLQAPNKDWNSFKNDMQCKHTKIATEQTELAHKYSVNTLRQERLQISQETCDF